MDLPFAGNKFCDTAGIKNLDVLSDYKDADFGTRYGVLIKEHRLDMRSIFIVDANDTVKYVQIVPEMTDHPDYEKAIEALKTIAK
jgi:thiol peroxidase